MTDDGQTVRMSQAEYTGLLRMARDASLMCSYPWTGPREVYVDDAAEGDLKYDRPCS